MVGLRVSPVPLGTMISEGVMASAHGLLEDSSTAILFPVLLSLLLSRMLFGSPLTALVLVKPEELDPELESPTVRLLEVILDVSMCSPLFGDLPLSEMSSSTHPAGVGGTGPKLDIGAGLRVGGDVNRSDVRVIL